MTLFNQEEELAVILSWNSTRKTDVYSPPDLPYLRKSSGNGTGFKYFCSHTNNYEKPKSMTLVPKKRLEAAAIQTRSASIASGSNDNNNLTDRNNSNNTRRKKLPADIRLHRIFGVV